MSVWVSHSSSATATLTTAASNRGDSEGKAGGIHEKFANNLRKAVPPGRDEAAQRPSATTVHPSRAERAKTHDMAWDAEASHGKNAELLAKAETEIQELQAQIESMEADLQVWKEKALELEEQQQQQPKGPLAASTALSSTADVWVLPPSTTNEIPHATLATATAAGVYRPPRDHNGILPPAMMPSHWNLYSPLKRLITAWRGALVDWHFLVPSLGAGFEGNGPCCGKGRFERLVANEAAVAAMLMDAKATTALGPIANDMYNPVRQCAAFPVYISFPKWPRLPLPPPSLLCLVLLLHIDDATLLTPSFLLLLPRQLLSIVLSLSLPLSPPCDGPRITATALN